MRKGMTFSGAGFLGMVAVSWVSILLVGGLWIYSMYLDFQSDSTRLREDYYKTQRTLVKGEVEEALQMVARMRHAAEEDVQRELEARTDEFNGMARLLASGMARDTAPSAVIGDAVRLMIAKDVDRVRLHTVRGDTVYLLAPFPLWLNREHVLSQIEAGVAGVDSGRRKIVLRVPQGMQPSTMTVSVRQLEGLGVRVVSGAAMEMAEDAVRLDALRALESVRYAKNGSLFGGTMEGESLVGPAKGRNMWDVTDSNGVKIVQELIAAAGRGGGFVTYVMPPLDGQRSATKVSYSAPIPDWQWYIGTGAFVDDIETVIELNREALKDHILERSMLILAGMAFISLIAFFLSHRLARTIKQNIASFTGVWNQATEGGGAIDIDAIGYAEFRELAEAANRMAADRDVAECALSDNLQQFSSVVSNIPGIVYHSEFSTDWVNKYISDSVLDITGYPPEEFLEGGVRTYQSIIHPEDKEWVQRTFRDDLKHHQAYMADYRIVRKDGGIRWMSERGQAKYDEQGDPVWLDGVIFDVTERRQAEEEYYSHVHFLETMERIDKAMHRSEDTDGMMENTLNAVRQAFGADRAWLLFPCDPEVDELQVALEQADPEYAQPVGENATVPVGPAMRQILKDALESPTPLVFDEISGRQVDALAAERLNIKAQMVFALRPRVGKPWLFGLHQCRSRRNWTKDEIRLFMEAGRRLADGLSTSLALDGLRVSEEQFRTFSEQTIFGLCMLQEGQTVYANKAFADLFETTVEDLKALPPGNYIKYVHPDDREFFFQQKIQLSEDGFLPKYTIRSVTETGRVKWVEVHARNTRVDGREAALFSVVDITALKRAGEDMEAIIADRTSALKDKAEELRKANAELKRLDQLKSAFLTTVSHAMRTPLTSVLGYAALMRKDLDKALDGDTDKRMERVGSNLDVLEAEGLRMRHLVDQFLELTDLEAGTDLRTEEAYPVGETVARAVEKAREASAKDCPVDLVLDLADGLPELTVAPGHLERILAHILENAFCFTREGRISVRVWSPDGVGVEVAVSDTGKGIPQEDLDAIFKPFHQVETGDTLVDEIKGAGLGLALSRMLVEKLGGRIWAQSEQGRGATFFVSIPG